MAVLALAGVPFKEWLRFAVPLCLALMALGLAPWAPPSRSTSSSQ